MAFERVLHAGTLQVGGGTTVRRLEVFSKNVTLSGKDRTVKVSDHQGIVLLSPLPSDVQVQVRTGKRGTSLVVSGSKGKVTLQGLILVADL